MPNFNAAEQSDVHVESCPSLPSAIMPETWNWILNPAHPQARRIRIGGHAVMNGMYDCDKCLRRDQSCRSERLYLLLLGQEIETRVRGRSEPRSAARLRIARLPGSKRHERRVAVTERKA